FVCIVRRDQNHLHAGLRERVALLAKHPDVGRRMGAGEVNDLRHGARMAWAGHQRAERSALPFRLCRRSSRSPRNTAMPTTRAAPRNSPVTPMMTRRVSGLGEVGASETIAGSSTPAA